ncbi:MAG: hypothetical protein HY909_30190 [Deltaproteobacteria bacterium]|nr:hypothetical protein [Deltaproteobacteria bacterium]
MARSPVQLFAALFAVASLARADLPPPPGWVETCTVRRQQRRGEHCVFCVVGATTARESCPRLRLQGYRLRCSARRSGRSIPQLWCRSPPPPPG